MLFHNWFYDITGPCRNNAGHLCSFPFVHEGVTYFECTHAGGYVTPWCYDTRGVGKWDHCSRCNLGMRVSAFDGYNITSFYEFNCKCFIFLNVTDFINV